MEGFAGWGQGREKKGGIEEKQREGTGSLDSWFLRGLSLSRERKLREAGKICGWWGDTLWSERNGGGAGGDFGAIRRDLGARGGRR